MREAPRGWEPGTAHDDSPVREIDRLAAENAELRRVLVRLALHSNHMALLVLQSTDYPKYKREVDDAIDATEATRALLARLVERDRTEWRHPDWPE